MYSYFNPNPQGNKVGDCVIRAIAKALDMSWEDVYLELTIQGYMMGDLLSSNGVWDAYLKGKGFVREIIPFECPDCYGLLEFANEHSEGTYVVGTGSHAICVRDGVIYDAWNSSNEIPIYYYRKEE